MKKIIFILICSLLFINNAYASIRAIDVARGKGFAIDDRYQPQGSIIVCPKTGTILWKEKEYVKWRPASMSKLMTIALAYDSIRDGKFSLDSEVSVSNKYVSISKNRNLSNNKVKIGCSYTVSELIDLIIVPSSAAATYMLADLIEPNRYLFVEKLNAKAKEIGMNNTRYINPIGVPNKLLNGLGVDGNYDDDNYTTAYDYALLCNYLINNYPDIINHTKNASIVVKKGTFCEESFTGYNHSLIGARHEFGGADGIKTGSAGMGYNYSMTAKRNDTRLVEIILGVSRWEDKEAEYIRHIIGNAILEDAFNKYKYKKVLTKGKNKINGKLYDVADDLYDIVPDNYNFEIVNDKIHVNYEREFLSGYKVNEVLVKEIINKKQEKKVNNKVKDKMYIYIGISIFISLVSLIIYKIKIMNKDIEKDYI